MANVVGICIQTKAYRMAKEQLANIMESFYYDREYGYLIPDRYRLLLRGETIKANDRYWDGTKYVEVLKTKDFVGKVSDHHWIIIRAGEPYLEDQEMKAMMDEIAELEENNYVGGE